MAEIRGGFLRDDDGALVVSAAVERRSAPLGLSSGRFHRVSPLPIVDHNAALRSYRDPGIYAERDGNWDNFWVWGALGEDALDGANTSNLGLATARVPAGVSPQPEDFTDQGIALNRSVFSGELGGLVTWVSPTPPVRDDDGTYHWYVVANDGFGPTTVGSVYHLTASSPDGPWTLDGPALTATGGEVAAYDNSAPVYYPRAASWPGSTGPYVITFMGMTNGTTGAHDFRIATAPSYAGPWTRVTPPTQRGGPGLNLDSPALLVDGDRLLMMICAVAYYNVWYDISNGVDAHYLARLAHSLGGSLTNSIETGASAWGGGSLCRIGDDVYFAHQALERAGGAATGYYRAFLQRWHPGRGYVPVPSTTLRGPTPELTASGNVDIPSWVPMDATAVDLLVLARKTVSAVVANEGVQLTSGLTSEAGTLPLFPQIQNANVSIRDRVPISPDKRFAAASFLNGLTSVSLQVFLMGYEL